MCRRKAEIGGFFELELNEEGEYYPHAIKLNSGRNALKYIIRTFCIREMHVPLYICPFVLQAINDEGCKIDFYRINRSFMPIENFKKDAFVLYINYLGICSRNVELLSQKYENLIIDNAQSFFMPPKGIGSFYSPRKFFGVSDGAYLFCDKKKDLKLNKDVSYERILCCLKKIDLSTKNFWQEYLQKEICLGKEPIKEMSHLTISILSNVNYGYVKQKRLENFEHVHSVLKNMNELNFELLDDDIPMKYPFLKKNEFIRQKCAKRKIWVSSYWDDNLCKYPIDSNEEYFQKYLFPLPIDQRYNRHDMNSMLDVVTNIC